MIRHRLLLVAAIGLAVLTACTSAFLLKFFGTVTFDQLLYHLQAGGFDHSDPKLLRRAARYVALAAALTVLAAWLVRRHGPRVGIALLAMSTGSAAVLAARTFDDGCDDPNDGAYIAGRYVAPEGLALRPPAAPPDVLIVFVESLEESYADARTFGSSLIPELSRWRGDANRFGEFHQIDGASWTIAGVFAGLCALPLKAVGLQSGNAYEFSRRFFSKGACLTDLLAAQGYEVSFYKGASLKFAGFHRFLEQHAVARRFGYEELAARGLAGPKENGWGLNDRSLLRIVHDDLAARDTARAPALDVVLTVDTHPPAGIVDAGCADAPGTPLDDAALRRAAYRCTDARVTAFLERVAAMRTGRDRIVVVLGDHVAMRSALDPELAEYAARQPRRVFLGMQRIDADGRRTPIAPPSRRAFSHLDLMPTVLAAAGWRWDGPGRIGLGAPLVGPRSGERTLVEIEGPERLDHALACRSPLYEAMW